MVSTIASYQMISNNLVRSLQQTARQPDVSRDTTYYLAHIGDVKSIDDFLGDYRLFSYAMKAYGLSDMTYAKAFMRKVLTEGVSSSSTFANKLADSRYKEFATAFDFFTLGQDATKATAAQSGTVEKYVRQALEENAGEQNEGVRLALYFERKAPTIKNAFSNSLRQGTYPGRPDRPWHFATYLNGRCRQAVGDADQANQFRGFSGSGKAEDVPSAFLRIVGEPKRGSDGLDDDALHPDQPANRDGN